MTENEQQQLFDDWLRQYKALIFKVVRAYGNTAADHDDLFQEIALQLWHSIPAFRHESAVTTWIYRIALNTAIKWVSRERKHREKKETLDNMPPVLQENTLPVDERLGWLYDAIHRLDGIDRSLTLLLLDGFTYKEMAAILGISESNVGVKINRIKKHLIAQSKKQHV